MTARTSEKRRNAFLRAFTETGNQGLAAEQAGVSRSTIYNLRRADGGFGARWRSAKAASAGRLAAGGSNRPPSEWKQRDGVELVVQRTGRRAPQVVRSLRARWTPRTEARFLGRLRLCNNAPLACKWAGLTLSSYEAHWRRWPDFRRRVAEARAFARLRIEAALEAERERPFELDREAVEALPEPGIAETIAMVRRNRRGRSRGAVAAPPPAALPQAFS
jgi:hypothetical protein